MLENDLNIETFHLIERGSSMARIIISFPDLIGFKNLMAPAADAGEAYPLAYTHFLPASS
jgi:hypothetical protein